jgi:hypothetical protein
MGNVPEHVRKDKLSTDSKTRTNDEHIHEEDKQHLHEERGKLGIPKREDNPALRDLKDKRGKKG